MKINFDQEIINPENGEPFVLKDKADEYPVTLKMVCTGALNAFPVMNGQVQNDPKWLAKGELVVKLVKGDGEVELSPEDIVLIRASLPFKMVSPVVNAIAHKMLEKD